MSRESRQDLFSIGVVIDGRDLKIFDKLSGGNADSDEIRYRPGGTPVQVSLGGSQTVENITVSRIYDLDRDNPLIGWLYARRGKAKAVVTVQPLDRDFNAFGSPTVYTGTLKAVQHPDVDSESSDAAMLALEVTVATVVA